MEVSFAVPVTNPPGLLREETGGFDDEKAGGDGEEVGGDGGEVGGDSEETGGDGEEGRLQTNCDIITATCYYFRHPLF